MLKTAAAAMADAIIALIDKTGRRTISLSPEDGVFSFDGMYWTEEAELLAAEVAERFAADAASTAPYSIWNTNASS